MTQNQQTSLVKTSQGIEKWNATEDQIQLLKNTVCRGATDDEFGLFMTVATRMGLDPFMRQIHAVQRWDPQLERKVMSIQVGIDGYRLMAERSGVYKGQEGPFWCAEDGVWRDVWLASTAPVAAKVVVWRTDKPLPFVATALWSSYVQTVKHKDGSFGVNAMWSKHGPGQLAKCAEALAFRKAFPVEIGGAAHVDEELEFIDAQAVESKPVFVAPPPPQGPPPGVPVTMSVDGKTIATATVHNVTTTEPQRRGPGRPPKDKSAERPTSAASTNSTSPAASSSPSPSAPASTSSAPASSGPAPTPTDSSSMTTDKWGQPVADPTSAGGSSASETSSATSETASTASTGLSRPDTGHAFAPMGAPADDGFGGEDPEDSQPAPTGDPGLQLIAEFQAFLKGCMTQTEMQNGRPPFAQRSAALFKSGDQRFAAATGGKPAGELALRMSQLWAERKAQLPV